MLNLKHRYEMRWNPALEPVGHGDFSAEEFKPWWARNRRLLENLHPQVAEQWVFRHWRWSPYRFLSLEDLRWRKETWPTERVLSEVYLEFGKPVDPRDYAMFRGEAGTLGSTSTFRNWTDGSWSPPVVVLSTPTGIDTYEGPLPDVRFVVLEGSLRYRYLWAAHHYGDPTGPHEVYILTSSTLD